jgi:transcription elongation factor Elf1
MEGGRFVLQKRSLNIPQKYVSRAFREIREIMADFYAITDEKGILKKQVGRFAGRVHRLGLKEFNVFTSGSQGLPKIVPLVLLYFTARPFYISFAEHVAKTGAVTGWTSGCCPVCGQAPLTAFLRAEDGARFLACGLCDTTWRFPRLACPFCDSPERAKARSFHLPGDEGRRVYVCEHCKTYLKTVDLGKLGRKPNLLLEYVATPHLDRLAKQSGYVPPDNLPLTLILGTTEETPVN